MTAVLGRKALAEFSGTAFLVAAVVGSGIAAVRLSPGNTGLQLLINSVVTGAALTALILALQPVSAAFNPAITLLERALGVVGSRAAVVLIGAQPIGADGPCGMAFGNGVIGTRNDLVIALGAERIPARHPGARPPRTQALAHQLNQHLARSHSENRAPHPSPHPRRR